MISIIVFAPLIAALIVGLNVRTMQPRTAHIITCGAMIIAALCSGIVFMEFASAGMAHGDWRDLFGGAGIVHKVNIASWINSGDFNVNWLLRVDALTAVMLVVVTWVSAVVHTYSVGYMSHDEHQPRFMAYLSIYYPSNMPPRSLSC